MFKNVGNKMSSDSVSYVVIINTSILLLFLCVYAWARVFASVCVCKTWPHSMRYVPKTVPEQGAETTWT